MGKIYDCFNFFNELDILEMRLNILYDHVDYFVIVESTVTHSGQPKPFYLEENKERFSKFWDKIISFKVVDTPEDFVNLSNTGFFDSELDKVHYYIRTQTNRFNRNTQADYGRDFFQKESVRRAIVNCNDEDIIIISDADEIPNPEILKKLNTLSLDNTIYSLEQPMYSYYLNMLSDSDWHGSKMGLYKNVKELSFNEIRGDSSLTTKLPDGGWHFSFMGGEEAVRTKITSYSARDLANEHVLSNIKNNIENDQDVFFRGKLTKVELDETYPKHILNNLSDYGKMIKT
jgi:beta-1,4-mannosyl-glycoprotein beta-1,4-N-acetylglucosaminyltransferase